MKPSERYDSLFQVWAAWDRLRDDTWIERKPPLDWKLLKRQAVVESGLDPDAISPVGAQGLTQFMSATWLEWERNEFGPSIPPNRHISPFDPEDSVRAQADMMAWLLGIWKGNVRKVLASYNWGIGNIKRTVEKYGTEWELHLPLETQRYLAKILEGAT